MWRKLFIKCHFFLVPMSKWSTRQFQPMVKAGAKASVRRLEAQPSQSWGWELTGARWSVNVCLDWLQSEFKAMLCNRPCWRPRLRLPASLPRGWGMGGGAECSYSVWEHAIHGPPLTLFIYVHHPIPASWPEAVGTRMRVHRRQGRCRENKWPPWR